MMDSNPYHQTKKDINNRMAGVIAFPLINVLAGFLLISSSYNWVLFFINILIIAVALFLRPQFALGYLLSIAIAIGGVVLSGTVFLTGCFILIVGGITIQQLTHGLVDPASAVRLVLVLLVVFIIFLFACYLLYLAIKKIATSFSQRNIEWEDQLPAGKGGDQSP
jgi:hypothetical protein